MFNSPYIALCFSLALYCHYTHSTMVCHMLFCRSPVYYRSLYYITKVYTFLHKPWPTDIHSPVLENKMWSILLYMTFIIFKHLLS